MSDKLRHDRVDDPGEYGNKVQLRREGFRQCMWYTELGCSTVLSKTFDIGIYA